MEKATATTPARNFNLYSSQCWNLAVIWTEVLGYSSRDNQEGARWIRTLVPWSLPLLNCQPHSTALFWTVPKGAFQDKARRGSRDSSRSRHCFLKGLWIRPHQGQLVLACSCPQYKRSRLCTSKLSYMPISLPGIQRSLLFYTTKAQLHGLQCNSGITSGSLNWRKNTPTHTVTF